MAAHSHLSPLTPRSPPKFNRDCFLGNTQAHRLNKNENMPTEDSSPFLGAQD